MKRLRFRLSTLLLLTACIATAIATLSRRNAWYVSKSVPSGFHKLGDDYRYNCRRHSLPSLVLPSAREFYRVDLNPTEHGHDRAKGNSTRVDAMEKRLLEYLASVNAEKPKPKTVKRKKQNKETPR